MRHHIEWEADESTPTREAVLAGLGLPAPGELPPRVLDLLDTALGIHRARARPRAVFLEVGLAAFARLYLGEGLNEARTPLEVVAPRADALALFVATIGDEVPVAIRELFERRDPALGYMLDGVASCAADALAFAAGREFLRVLANAGRLAAGARVLPYSPGYCGWHVSGQRALFAVLEPSDIDVSLNQSCLMLPLKSVSGVLVVGSAEAHHYDQIYPCCETCATRACEDRMALVRDRGTTGVASREPGFRTGTEAGSWLAQSDGPRI